MRTRAFIGWEQGLYDGSHFPLLWKPTLRGRHSCDLVKILSATIPSTTLSTRPSFSIPPPPPQIENFARHLNPLLSPFKSTGVVGLPHARPRSSIGKLFPNFCFSTFNSKSQNNGPASEKPKAIMMPFATYSRHLL